MTRLVFDLFPCQTASRLRGIGRYTQSLANAMVRLCGDHEIYALVNGGYPDSANVLRTSTGALLPSGHFVSYTHPRIEELGGASIDHTMVSTALIHGAYQAISADVVLCASVFEDEGVIPLPKGGMPSALRVAILYDLIPLLFPEQYLHVPQQRAWYEKRLASLKSFDLLLAISEATRQDAIRILDFNPDHVVNISGAAGEIFRPVPPSERKDASRFGITKPFVLYTGNADYRKNQDGMLCAYADLPPELRKTHQLVLNQVGNVDAFRRRMRRLGLGDEEVVITGHITDDDLISLYAQCKVFVFPSLYEGFGLPALEAMACGAPVIAGNNSSIPEVIGRSDVLFDAANTHAITAAMQNVLTNDALRTDLSRYGVERAKTFNWDKTASLAWRAIEARLVSKGTPVAVSLSTDVRKERIAVVCPMHAEQSPAVRHTAGILPYLAQRYDVDVFVEQGTPAHTPSALYTVYPHSQFAARQDLYATVIYQMANDACHAYMLPMMLQNSGVVILHDLSICEAIRELGDRPHSVGALAKELFYCSGLKGFLDYLENKDTCPISLNRRLLESAEQLLLLNASDINSIAAENGKAWLPPMTVLPVADMVASLSVYMHAIQAAAASDHKHIVRHVAEGVGKQTGNDTALNLISMHAAQNSQLRKRPRLLVDVTQLARTDARSGIQRVVRNIAREITHLADCPIELVRHHKGKLRRASGVIASIFETDADSIPEQDIAIQPGDTLLMIDSSWEQYDEFLNEFQLVRQMGGRIITVVYDIIPLRFPELCLPALVEVFRRWFPMAVRQSDALLCISRSVAEEVGAYLAQQTEPLPNKPALLHWPLGADIEVRTVEATIRHEVRSLATDKASPLFLMVGTIEPRKGHTFALEAFEELWREGFNARLCIAGSVGWIAAETVDRIRNHPEMGKRLFFIESFTDAEIGLCYAAATGLIAASTAEGFGLPIVEAAIHKVPTLAADIQVFHEVGGEGARYFSLASPRYLADAVREFSSLSMGERLEMASRIKTVTWRQSSAELLAAIGISEGQNQQVIEPGQVSA